MVAVAPDAIVPKLHGKTVAQLPEFETNVRPAGVVSATETAVATLGPLFVTTTVNTTFCPATAEAGPVLVIARSADCPTLVVAVAELFPATGSEVVEETVAVFEIEAAAKLPGTL